jgi:hypothetical protein
MKAVGHLSPPFGVAIDFMAGGTEVLGERLREFHRSH